MKENEIRSNEDLMLFLDSFKTAKERGEFMRQASNDLLNRFIALSTCVATKMWLAHYKK